MKYTLQQAISRLSYEFGAQYAQNSCKFSPFLHLMGIVNLDDNEEVKRGLNMVLRTRKFKDMTTEKELSLSDSDALILKRILMKYSILEDRNDV